MADSAQGSGSNAIEPTQLGRVALHAIYEASPATMADVAMDRLYKSIQSSMAGPGASAGTQVHQPDTTALQQCAPARALGLQIAEVARALVAMHTGEGSNEAEVLLLRVFKDYMQVAPPDADADADADDADADADDADALAEFAGGIEFSENEVSMFWMDVNKGRVAS